MAANDGVQPNMHPVQNVPGDTGKVIRAPYWPTLPRQSNHRDIVSQLRFYSCGVAPADADNILNAPIAREVRFNLPSILLAVTGTCITSDGSGLPVGWAPNDCYEVWLTAGSGSERITITSRLASTVVGTAERPGFFGGNGWFLPNGSVLDVQITPRLPGLANGVNTRIDLSFHVMEFKSGASYINPG